MAHYIRERFPVKKHSIERLMAEDPEFHSICEDHNLCVNALQHWIKSKEPEAKTRINEYQSITRQLEEEVIQALDAYETRRLD